MRSTRRRLLIATTLAPLALLPGCTTPAAQPGPASTRPAPATARPAPARGPGGPKTAPPRAATSRAAVAPATASAPAAPPSEARRMIDAAGQLPFSSERAEALLRIARRSDLTADDQIALVDAACRVEASEQITAVLLALANNPTLAPAARAHLVQSLDCIPFSIHRQQVREALERSGGG